MQQRTETSSHHILRLPDVIRKTGISRTAVYQKIRSGEFPAPVSLGERAVGFVEDEIDTYIATLMRVRSTRREQATA